MRITLKICPATSNAPVTMTDVGWEALCKSTQERRNQDPYCAECKGEKLHPGLTLMPLGEMMAGPANNQIKEKKEMGKPAPRGTCDSCGDTNLVLKQNYGKMQCGKCASMYSNVRNWLPVIEKALQDIWPEKYGAGADCEPATISPSIFSRLAGAVKYEGKSIEDLTAIIEGAGRAQDAMLADANRQLAEVMEDAKVTQESLAAMRAEYNEATRVRDDYAHLLCQIGELFQPWDGEDGFDCLVAKVRDLITVNARNLERAERLVQENKVLACQVSELEKQPDPYNLTKCAAEPIPVHSHHDSVLLDLALDAMAGDVIIGADWIRRLRETRA